MWQARKRGVIFDLGHGAGSFWFRNAVPASRWLRPRLDQHRPPHGQRQRAGAEHVDHDVEVPGMGMPLADVISRSTVTPAREIGRPELGTLTLGADADVAVFKHLAGDFGYVDCGKAKLIGHEKLECRLTIRAGQIVYDPEGLSVPEWEQRPPRTGGCRNCRGDLRTQMNTDKRQIEKKPRISLHAVSICVP